MQEEQGFDSHAGVELVEFTYRPYSLQKQNRKNVIPPAKSPGDHIETYLPQQDDCRQACTKSVTMRDQKYIVFNNFNHQVGLQQNQLVFQTQFESSNLEIAIRRRYLDYELYLRPDTNTPNHFQWFYFRVRSLRGHKNVTFTIKNFVKGNMLYNDGLRPYFKSSRYPGEDYKQLPTEVKFIENICEDYYSLKFQYEFELDGETIELCSQPPYSYSRMMDMLKLTRAETFTLCKSLLHKRVPYMVYNEKKTTKAIGIVIARQHPGESVGSWIMQGFLSRLQSAPLGQIMWVVFPMVNVDGVILGNNRTGISGLDYNRCWNVQQLQKKEKYLPEIMAIFNIIKHLRKKYPKKMKMFLDLHGHSSQPNVFSYGPPHEQFSEYYFISKVFPELISRKNQNFSIQQCSYVIRQDKKNTARSLLFNYFGVPFSYTIEGSFGLMRGERVGAKEFVKIGEDLVDTAHEFLNTYVLKEKSTEVTSMVDYIREKYKDNQQAEEYDSDSQLKSENLSKDFQDKTNKSSELQLTGKCLKLEKVKLVTEVSTPRPKESLSHQKSFHLFKAELSANHRYHRNSERKRNETEITLSREKKLLFPKIKENLISRQKLNSIVGREAEQPIAEAKSDSPTMTNIRDIHKRLYKLRHNRIGKKILIINAYGV